eukprot:gb/GEZN01011582.1/.p1 GENE.gb/GEZN01011582.1/~~gb/GEZN01011582.1/.p1  ORF type:complete len:238 (-),score=38.47 gb/GEZN01011582.1/:423-1136(-)
MENDDSKYGRLFSMTPTGPETFILGKNLKLGGETLDVSLEGTALKLTKVTSSEDRDEKAEAAKSKLLNEMDTLRNAVLQLGKTKMGVEALIEDGEDKDGNYAKELVKLLDEQGKAIRRIKEIQATKEVLCEYTIVGTTEEFLLQPGHLTYIGNFLDKVQSPVVWCLSKEIKQAKPVKVPQKIMISFSANPPASLEGPTPHARSTSVSPRGRTGVSRNNSSSVVFPDISRGQEQDHII